MTTSERFWIWLAWRLPRRLTYWAYVRVATFGTTVPPLSSMNPAEQTILQPMQRWEES